MNFTLLWPFYVCLILLLCIVGARFSSNLNTAFPRANRVNLNLLLKALAALLISLALCGPYYQTTYDKNSAVLLLDISKSMDLRTVDQLLDRAKAFQDAGIDIRVVPFAAEASSLDLGFDKITSLDKVRSSFSRLNYSATDLPSALGALSSFGSSNALLISDGFSNKGNLKQALSQLESSSFRVFPLLNQVSNISQDYFGISNLYAPLIAPAGKHVDIRLSLKNSSAQKQSGKLEVFHDSKKISARSVEVEAGNEKLLILQSDPALEGIREIRANFVPDNSNFASSSETIYLSSEPREKVLLISGSAEDQRFLNEVLQKQSYQLQTLDASSGLSSLPAFEDFSAVILNNVALKQLPSSAAILAEKYVKAGGGLIMIGGSRSFGLGGYKDTPIEELLPLKLAPPQTAQKRLNIGVELVLDKSRSMSDGNKIEFAKEAAREVVRKLKDDDLVGVIGFDSAPFEVVRLAALASNRDQAIERIGRLFPSGKTNLLPAMDEARRRLENAQAGRKHMIVLTDGQLPDAGPYYLELVKQMRFMGITVSTVLLGAEADFGLLKQMGEVGGGAFYQTSDARSLPRIFLNDIKVSSGEQTLKEDQEYLVRQGPDGAPSISARNFPPIKGYVQTTLKSGALAELVAYGSQKAEPLLATWQYGKGRSIGFTSDASGRWSSYWIGWPKFQTFWSELIDTIRPQDGPALDRVPFELRYFVEHGSLVLDLSIFSEESAADIKAELILPSSKSLSPIFNRVSRGNFRAVVDDPQAGKYELRAKAANNKLTPLAFKLPDELFGEKRWQGFNLEVLNQIASVSGAKLNPDIEDLRSATARRSEKHDLTPWFLLAALLLLIFEIFKREILSTLFKWPSKTLKVPLGVKTI